MMTRSRSGHHRVIIGFASGSLRMEPERAEREAGSDELPVSSLAFSSHRKSFAHNLRPPRTPFISDCRHTFVLTPRPRADGPALGLPPQWGLDQSVRAWEAGAAFLPIWCPLVFARDPDSLVIFTRHEEEGAFVVEMILLDLLGDQRLRSGQWSKPGSKTPVTTKTSKTALLQNYSKTSDHEKHQ
jgi:hypothetical protein